VESRRASDALRALPNSGAALGPAELPIAGVHSSEELKRLGALGAAPLLLASDLEVCANKLHALEGAIRGIRWHDIPEV